ncbi:hypothetical protein Tco_1545675, partial [Tanacetum coccineum]
KGNEPEVEVGGNEAEYFDPFNDIDDILGKYAKDNRVEAESHKAILGEVEKEADIDFKSGDDIEDEGDNHKEFKVNDDSDGL